MAATMIYDMSTLFTGGAYREDLMDVINIISPTDTPCYTMFRKVSVSNVQTEWLTDKLDVAASNAVAEGAAFSPTAAAVRARMTNVCQISREGYEISDTLRAVNAAGIRDEFRYQMGKAMRQWKRDVEHDIIAGSALTGAASAGTRSARGIFFTLKLSCSITGNVSNTTLNVQEDELNGRLMAVWTNGGLCDYVLCTPLQKRAISTGFAGSVNSRRNAQLSENTVVNVVDFYLSDFGQVKIMPHRWFSSSVNGVNLQTVTLLLQSDKWVLGFLRPPKNVPLSKIGSSERAMVEGEWTLIGLHPSANSYLSGHASGTFADSFPAN